MCGCYGKRKEKIVKYKGKGTESEGRKRQGDVGRRATGK
jgi:hypothetical protein